MWRPLFFFFSSSLFLTFGGPAGCVGLGQQPCDLSSNHNQGQAKPGFASAVYRATNRNPLQTSGVYKPPPQRVFFFFCFSLGDSVAINVFDITPSTITLYIFYTPVKSTLVKCVIRSAIKLGFIISIPLFSVALFRQIIIPP
jgi:hypothetical protein